MTTTRVDIVFDNFDEIARRLPVAVAGIVEETLDDIHATVVASMNEPKSGRMYGTHQASAPGEAPAIDTTRLIKSLARQMVSQQKGIYFTDVDYAPGLELGTTRVAPRPFMKPAAETVRPKWIQKLSNLERHLR